MSGSTFDVSILVDRSSSSWIVIRSYARSRLLVASSGPGFKDFYSLSDMLLSCFELGNCYRTACAIILSSLGKGLLSWLEPIYHIRRTLPG